MPKKNKLKITLVRSKYGILPNHQACVKGLGLRRMHHTVILSDDVCIRGLINKISHLLLVEEV